MNSKIKIAVAMATGLVAGATLIGAAFAAPQMMTGPAANGYGYGMMRSYGGSATGTPSIADMNAFMDRYRVPDGSIDFDRMHADVASGAVTMPYTGRSVAGARIPRSRSGSGVRLSGSRMMGGTGAIGGYTTGYGMMGSSY